MLKPDNLYVMQLNKETGMPLHKADGTTLCVHKERAVGGVI